MRNVRSGYYGFVSFVNTCKLADLRPHWACAFQHPAAFLPGTAASSLFV